MLRLWQRLSRENKAAAVLLATSAGLGILSVQPAGWRKVMSWQAHGMFILNCRYSNSLEQECGRLRVINTKRDAPINSLD